LTSGGIHSARIAQPNQGGVRDRAAFWLSSTNPRRRRWLKECIARGFRLSDRLLGTIPTMNLEVVVEKVG